MAVPPIFMVFAVSGAPLVAGERCPETASIVRSVPDCRDLLSSLDNSKFWTRIDNGCDERPVQRDRPLHYPGPCRNCGVFLHVTLLWSLELAAISYPELPAWKSALPTRQGSLALRTAQLLPLTGFRRWAPPRPVSRPERQPATGLPGDYPDRTFTGRRRGASDQVMIAGRSPPALWAHLLPY